MITIAILLVIFVVILAMAIAEPDTSRIERSTNVHASPEQIFPLINDFHRWTLWSPFENRDADLARSYSGSEKGDGAVYEWNGKKSGSGRMEITRSSPPSRVVIDLNFTRPFKARNTTEFAIEPDDGYTRLTWSMEGKNSFVAKLLRVFFNVDQMVGKDFESGLTALKDRAEQGAADVMA